MCGADNQWEAFFFFSFSIFSLPTSLSFFPPPAPTLLLPPPKHTRYKTCMETVALEAPLVAGIVEHLNAR